MAGVDLATLRAGPRVCSAVALGGERLALSRLGHPHEEMAELAGVVLVEVGEQACLGEGEAVLGAATSGPWVRWAALVERRPRVLSLVALVVMVTLTLPVFSLRLGSSDAGNNPASTTTRKAYDLLADGFGPGFNGPLQLVAEAPSAADKAALTELSARLENVEGVASVNAMPIRPGSTVGIVQVVPTTSPQDEETSDLIDRLRDEVIPAAEKGTALKVHVGGPTAIFDDFATVLTGKLPLFIAVIVILGGLLLMLAFRSLLIPAVAAVMNLLAAGASFGILIAVFQWGWGSAGRVRWKPSSP